MINGESHGFSGGDDALSRKAGSEEEPVVQIGDHRDTKQAMKRRGDRCSQTLKNVGSQWVAHRKTGERQLSAAVV
jgi:hypothetical protein